MKLKNYLEMYHLDTPELIAKHIWCLKRNTKPDLVLISSLAEKLIKKEIEKLEGEDDLLMGQIKDDVIFNYNEGEKDTMEYLKGVKHNKNKPQISLLFKQFSKSLQAISRCSQYGHEKYKEADKDYLNYQRVDGGSKTYADAGLRHRLEQGYDMESGLPHQFHVAWNSLAELELWIQENE